VNDTRKDARLSVALVTRYREPTMLEPREGECRDLSGSGMFITTQRPSPRGALIRFECVSDQPEDCFRGTGRVVWQRNKPDDRGPAGMGVRFVRLEAGGREALERTIARISSGRPPSRTPRPSNRAPANARARQEEAVTQAVPIFAAGTASSSGSAQPVGSTPLPSAPSSNTARFPQLRSSTLRGVAIPGEIKRVSSNPPPDGARAGNTPLPLPPRSPSPARNGANGDRRDRLDRTRRGVGPQDLQSSPVTSAPDAAAAPRNADSDRAVADAKAARTGTDSERPAGDASAAQHSDRPVRPASAVATQHGVAAPSASERPPRERQSDRPPRPGGTDDLRARGAQPSDPPEAGSGSGPRPRDIAFARTTLKEVAVGLREGAAGRSQAASQPAPAARQLSANAGFSRTERDTTEKRIPIAGDINRYERGSTPDFEQERSNSRWLLWLIAGTGLLMSYLVVRMFGGGLPDIPGETISAEVAASNAKAASNTAPTAEAHMPYVLAVTTQPAGARVTAAGVSVVAPGDLRLDGLRPPLQVEAELAGYEKASATLWPSQFERHGSTYEGKVALTLQVAANGVPAATKPPDKTAANSAQPPTKPHDSDHAAAPARSASSEARHKDSPTPPRTPPRRAAKVAPATVAITPADPPAPSPPPEPTSAHVAATPQQTPLAEALDCLGRGDNRCVIRALEDKAGSAREFELLIETYRAVGSTPRAERQMQSYLQRFPEGQRAAEYRRLLERRAPSASPESAPPHQAP
jgi:hypothetical protein